MQEKKDRIAKVAKEMFAMRGYSATTVDEIACKAGLNKAMVYYYFKSKLDLYRYSIAGSIRSVLANLRESIETTENSESAMKLYIKAFYKEAKEDDSFLRILLREVASGGENLSEEIIGVFVDVLQILERILKKGVEKGQFKKIDTKMVHFSVIGAVSFYLCSRQMRMKFEEVKRLPSFLEDSDNDIEELCEIIVRGLKK